MLETSAYLLRRYGRKTPRVIDLKDTTAGENPGLALSLFHFNVGSGYS